VAGSRQRRDRRAWRDRLRILRLLGAAGAGAGRPAVAALVGLFALEAVLFPAEIAATGWLVGSLPDRRQSLTALGVLAAVLVVRQVLGPLGFMVGARIRRRIDGSLLERTQHALYRPVGLAHLHDPSVLDQLNLGGGANASNPFAPETPGGAAVGMVRQAAAIVACLLAGTILLRASWPAAVVVLAASLAARRHTQRHHTAMLRRFRDLAGGYRRAGYTASLATTPAAAKEARIYGLGHWLVDRYRREWDGVTAEMGVARAVVRARNARANLLLAAVHAGVFVHVGLLATDGRIGVGLLTAALWGSVRLGSLAHLTSDDFRVDQGSSRWMPSRRWRPRRRRRPGPCPLAPAPPPACPPSPSASRASGSATPAVSTNPRCLTASTSRSRRGPPWPWWAQTARGRPRRSSCWPASTSPRPAASWWTGSP
jgi:ATP-binding cassette subfamily B protein